jgi:UDP-MurNAc hydroxylase
MTVHKPLRAAGSAARTDTSTFFQTLSHAGLRVSASGRELICDPWLVGSCYWRSWWNYPPVPAKLVEGLAPDFIYLTHLHWDHFQGPSLKRFAPETPIFVPFDRYDRMRRDLQAIGMKDIREIRHGERIQLAPKLAIRSYHFSPFVTDSALVIEAGDTVLLNANDAKLAGAPLRQVLKAYPQIDFCFRSHSSANARACHHVIGEPDTALDDNDHYLRAFSLFIERVRPRYAVPFASNNCLLHDDTFHMNPLVQTPHLARDYFARFAAERGLDTQLQIMVPGDRWSEQDGFEIAEQDWFERRDEHLEAYRARVRPTLDRQAKIESKVKVSLSAVERFFAKLAKATPRLLRRPLKGREVLLVSRSERETAGFAVDLAGGGKVRAVPPEAFDQFDARIEFPALILLQSMSMNMFGHAAISKRVHYHATKEAWPALDRFKAILEWYECELLPLKGNLSRRSIRALLPRWREGLLYARVLIDLTRGHDLPTIEERQLVKS